MEPKLCIYKFSFNSHTVISESQHGGLNMTAKIAENSLDQWKGLGMMLPENCTYVDFDGSNMAVAYLSSTQSTAKTHRTGLETDTQGFPGSLIRNLMSES